MASHTKSKLSAVVAEVAGTHYETASGMCPHCGEEVQHWDLYAERPYLEGMATKYVTRWRQKGGLQDLDKAISAIQKIKARELLKARGREAQK
jgi:hypothetical protein